MAPILAYIKSSKLARYLVVYSITLSILSIIGLLRDASLFTSYYVENVSPVGSFYGLGEIIIASLAVLAYYLGRAGLLIWTDKIGKTPAKYAFRVGLAICFIIEFVWIIILLKIFSSSVESCAGNVFSDCGWGLIFAPYLGIAFAVIQIFGMTLAAGIGWAVIRLSREGVNSG